MSVRWNSPEFWNAIRGRFAFVQRDGTPYSSDARPKDAIRYQWDINDSDLWRRLSCMDIADLPSPSRWKDSLIERPYDWQPVPDDAPMDTPVWVYAPPDPPLYPVLGWLLRYYAGSGRVWANGRRSYDNCMTLLADRERTMVLADPNDPDRKPPDDWRPTATEGKNE